jgi:hypothetical protein
VGACLANGFNTAVGASGTTTASGSAAGAQIPAQLAAFSEIDIQPSSSGASSGGSATSSAIVTGELALLPTEIEPTIHSLIQTGFDISAVHNHTVFIAPGLTFVHFSATGDPTMLTQQIQAAITAGRGTTTQ